MINPNTNSQDPLVVVVGSTGAQGLSVVGAFERSERSYRVRGLTRDASKPTAEDLKKRGVQVHAVDLYAAPHEDVVKSFEGATYIFLVTQFDITDPNAYEKEVAEGKILFTAAANTSSSPKLVIFSSLTHMGRASNGKYTNAWNYDAKADIVEWVKATYPKLPLSEVQCGMYFEMFPGLWVLRQVQGKEGEYEIIMPTSPNTVIPMLWCRDYGRYVRGLVEMEGSNVGKVLHTGGDLKAYQIAEDISKAMGAPVRFTQDDNTTSLVYDVGHAIQDCGYYGGADPKDSEKYLDRPLSTFAEYAAQVDWHQALGRPKLY